MRTKLLIGKSERGAAMIEYALLAACFLLSLSAVLSLEEGATATFFTVEREMTCTGVSGNGALVCPGVDENDKL